jgi:hypothetical protein
MGWLQVISNQIILVSMGCCTGSKPTTDPLGPKLANSNYIE